MDEIKAGVVLITKFVSFNSKEFSNYINYIDRTEAIRNDNAEKYISDNLYNKNNADYLEYMGNPIKTTALFDEINDVLTPEQKERKKELFIMAQKNESLMWQTVFSFDNRWLEKYNLYNSETKEVNESQLKKYVRDSMGKMLVNEGLENAIWTAAIHYNTDNIHIHIATTEPIPRREKRETGRFKGEYKGKWKPSTIRLGKSCLANNIIKESDMNKEINEIFRGTILDNKKHTRMVLDPEFNTKFLQLYYSLPVDKKTWWYNTNAMNLHKQDINELVDMFVDKFHKEDFQKFKELLKEQDHIYTEIFGSKNNHKYYYNKINDFYSRMGNAVLNEMLTYDYEVGEGLAKAIKYEKIERNRKLHKNQQWNKIDLKNYINNRKLARAVDMLVFKLNANYKSMRNQWVYQEELEFRQELQKMKEEKEI